MYSLIRILKLVEILRLGGTSGLKADALKGGEQGSIPYQDGANSTTFLPPTNAAGRFLKSNGLDRIPSGLLLVVVRVL